MRQPKKKQSSGEKPNSAKYPAIGSVSDEKKKKKEEKQAKREDRRANRKAERALNPFNQPPKSRRNSKDSAGLFDDGLSGGGCKDGNSRGDCPEVQTTTSGKAPKFNPNKRTISRSRLVGSKKKRDRQAKKQAKAQSKAISKNSRNILGNPSRLWSYGSNQ